MTLRTHPSTPQLYPIMSAANRTAAIASQLNPASQGLQAILKKNDDDVVICAAVRTAITRAKKGGFKDTCPEELLSAVLKAVIDRSGIPIDLVEEVQAGSVLPAGSGATVGRMAQLAGESAALEGSVRTS